MRFNFSIILRILIIFSFFSSFTFAETGDILCIKFTDTPVQSSINQEITGNKFYLNKGYIVADQGELGDYTKVKLTDNSYGYILKSNLSNNNYNGYNISGNFGKSLANAYFYEKPSPTSNRIGVLEKGISFNILHVNYVNNNYVYVEIITGKYKDKKGYIHKNYVDISYKEGYKSKIVLFIEENSIKIIEENNIKNIEENNIKYTGLIFDENIIGKELYSLINVNNFQSQWNIDITKIADKVIDNIYKSRNDKTKFPTEQSYVTYLTKLNKDLNNLKSTLKPNDLKYIFISYISSGVSYIEYFIEEDIILNIFKTHKISGSFGTTGSGAAINVCGINTISDSTGGFTATRDNESICNTIAATKVGYTCATTIQGPASLTGDITNIAGNCTAVAPTTYTVSGSFGTNGAGATVSVCETNVTADVSGNFTTTKNSGSACNTITATRAGYTCSTTTNGPASLTTNATNIAGNCTAVGVTTYTVSGSFGTNGAGATVNVCGTNVTANASGNFTATRNSGSTCNAITAIRVGYTCNTTTNGPASLTANATNIAGNCTALNEFIACTGTGQIKTAATKYPGVLVSGLQPIHPACDTADIIVCSGVGTGYTLSACNIGTGVAGTGTGSYGMLFQRGRNKGFSNSDTSQHSYRIPGTVGLNASTDTEYGFVWHNGLYQYQWSELLIPNQWGHVTNTNIARQGPCGSGYHVPSLIEWQNIVAYGGWNSYGLGMVNDLKIPLAGYRSAADGNYKESGTVGNYWSSTNGTHRGESVQYFYFANNYIKTEEISIAYGNSIRCFKN